MNDLVERVGYSWGQFLLLSCRLNNSSIEPKSLSFCLEIERKIQIVLAYRYYNDGIVNYNLTFCTKKSRMTDLDQPRFCRKATADAVLQPPKQRRPNPRNLSRRCSSRSQRLPQGQGRRKARRIRREFVGARRRRLRHPLHRLRKIPLTKRCRSFVKGILQLSEMRSIRQSLRLSVGSAGASSQANLCQKFPQNHTISVNSSGIL